MKILKIIGISIGIILVISLIISMPFILDVWLYSTHEYDSHLTSAEWSSFNGSYIGAIMGGIVTLIGIWITIKFQQKQINKDRQFQMDEANKNRQFQLDEAKKDREFQRDQANDDRRLSIAPYLKYNVYEEGTAAQDNYEVIMRCLFDNKKTQSYNVVVRIKNIGMGPAIDVNIYNESFSGKNTELWVQPTNEILEKDNQWFMLIFLGLELDEAKNKTGLDMFVDKTGILKFKVRYKDLLQYQYEQEVEISIKLSFVASRDENKWTCNLPELKVIKTGELKIINK